MTSAGFDNHAYNLVFSDEFELDGRTFYPGDDPYWEAVDLHYWGTGDYEWNDPDASRLLACLYRRRFHLCYCQC